MESLLAGCTKTVHRLYRPQEPHGLHNDENVESTTSTMVRVTIDIRFRSEEHTSELQSQSNLVCRLLLEKKKKTHLKCDKIHRILSLHTTRAAICSIHDLTRQFDWI